jgi:hypothetical protein
MANARQHTSSEPRLYRADNDPTEDADPYSAPTKVGPGAFRAMKDMMAVEAEAPPPESTRATVRPAQLPSFHDEECDALDPTSLLADLPAASRAYQAPITIAAVPTPVPTAPAPFAFHSPAFEPLQLEPEVVPMRRRLRPIELAMCLAALVSIAIFMTGLTLFLTR